MNSKTKTTSTNSVKNAYMGRTNADIFRILTLALQKSGDKNLTDVHILRVECSADLSTARVFINGGLKHMEGISAFLRNEIAQNMKVRKVPSLRFIIDDGAKNTARVEELLNELRKGK